jgi:DNA-binding transcriptional LysR family regulator
LAETRHLDLNLLRIFLILWDERSVSRAAAKVHITQSAMSHSLKRLRVMLDDDLFDRSPQGLKPTPYAISLERRVRRALRQVEIAVEPPEFNPLESDRSFVIATGPHNCAILVPHILTTAKREAPAIKIKVVQLSPLLGMQMEAGAVDLAIGTFDQWPSTVNGTTLYREDMVWVGRTGLRFDAPVSDEMLRNMDRVEISSAELSVRIGDRETVQPRTTLRPQDGVVSSSPPLPPSRAAEITVYDNRTAMEIVARSDMIAILPRSAVRRYGEAIGVSIIATDLIPASTSVSMVWSQQQSETAGHQWFTCLIENATANMVDIK